MKQITKIGLLSLLCVMACSFSATAQEVKEKAAKMEKVEMKKDSPTKQSVKATPRYDQQGRTKQAKVTKVETKAAPQKPVVNTEKKVRIARAEIQKAKSDLESEKKNLSPAEYKSRKEQIKAIETATDNLEKSVKKPKTSTQK